MTPLKRTLIEKAGHDHGFEHVLPSSASAVNMSSARHPARLAVSLLPQGYAAALVQGPPTLWFELYRSFASLPRDGAAFIAATDADLAQWLRRASA